MDKIQKIEVKKSLKKQLSSIMARRPKGDVAIQSCFFWIATVPAWLRDDED
jgi:hypothetical protein